MSLPAGMLASTWERICRLPSDRRDRVLERAAILHFEAGVPFPDADEMALANEGIFVQQKMVGT